MDNLLTRYVLSNTYRVPNIVVTTDYISVGVYNTEIEALYANAAIEILLPGFIGDNSGEIFTTLANVDPTFDFDRFKYDMETYGFEFSDNSINELLEKITKC